MKRYLSLLLAFILILTVPVSCGTPKETESEEEVATPETEIETEMTNSYQTTTYTMKDAEGLFKPLGRTDMLGNSLTCDFPASGAEFKADCRGTVTISFTAKSADQKLSVYLDGEFSREITTKSGIANYTVAENLPEGEHTLRIVAQYGYSLNTLNKITLDGTLLAAEEKDVYIEFIGASSIGGYGLSPTNQYDATKSISYTAIELLDVDYTLFAQGGMGIAYGNGDGHTVNRKYPLQSNNRGKDSYVPEKTPDIIIFNLGQNDNHNWYTDAKNDPNHEVYNYETFDAAVAEFFGTLDLLYGEKAVPIVFVSGIITREERSIATKRLEELIKTVYIPAGYDILICPVTTDRSGYNSHSTPEGAKKQGEELAAFIQSNFPWLFE